MRSLFHKFGCLTSRRDVGAMILVLFATAALAQSTTPPPNPPSFGGQPPASEAAVRQAAADQPEQIRAVPAALPTFKVFQFPADQAPRIDGDDSDWAMVPDSYAITLADMHDDEHKHAAPDPKDLSIKVKVGWVKGLHRLYFLYEADDNYWDFADPGLHNDTFEIVVDGDRSGGPLVPQFRNNPDQDYWDAHFSMHGVQAQNYHIFTPSEGKDWAMDWGCAQWDKALPYANHAQKYSFRPGESGHYVLEFYITPFDYAGCEGPQRAVESLLTENKLIGLSWAVIDYDGSPDKKNNGFWNLSPEHKMYGNATLLREFRLMPLEPSLQKPIDAHWGFEVLDAAKRLVAFRDESTSTGPITSWHWDFGDNTTSTEQNPIHQYKAGAEYTVVLDIEGAKGKSRFSRVWDVTIR
ncbi:MAG TPA: PKD domain-containing protein [Acidobacteriaceae bacterium]|nr:PKD domain-containing protein [Acidobacteriaceae bacterium]